MTTEVTFPPVVKGRIQSASDLPTAVYGTQAGKVRLTTTVFREEEQQTRLDNQAVPEASSVELTVWYPHSSTRPVEIAAGDLRAVARALNEHADAIEAQTGTEIL